MNKEFNFKIIDKTTNLRYTAAVKVELKNKKENMPVLSISASVGNGSRYLTCGQCLNTIANDYNFKNPDEKIVFIEIFNLWQKHHLNDMRAGTPKQTAALNADDFKTWRKEQNFVSSNYTIQCAYLESVGLFIDSEFTPNGQPQSPENIGKTEGYKYGYGWIYQPIPPQDLERIHTLLLK